MKNTGTRPRNLSWAITCIGLVLFFIGLYIKNSANCSAMIPGVIAAFTTVLLGLIAVGRTYFVGKQEREQIAAIEYQKQHGKNELFDDADEAVRLATKANRQYVKFFVPFFTILLGLVMLALGLGIWFAWKRTDISPVAIKPLPMAILASCCCIGTLIAGSFFVGASREQGCRWLRPSSAWMFLTGFLYLLSGIALFLEYFQKFTLKIDIIMAEIGMVIILGLAVELLLNFIVEFYRPRMPGEAERPLPESRLLALFTEPGGVARNVAASLDYQFGFQVSEAWFYRFLERTVVPLFVVMLLAFWLQTCLVVIETDQNGIREFFGRVTSQEPLPPGLYCKLPLPFERIYRYPVEQVRKITIGGHAGEVESATGEHDEGADKDNDKGEQHDKIILWDIKKAHGGAANFIVADTSEPEGQSSIYNSSLRMSILSAHIPLYFKVKNLYDYAYRHQYSGKSLKNVACRELIRYMAGADFTGILGHQRYEASAILKKRIQEASDAAQLGIEVIFVGLVGLHPPVGVGGAFDNVVASREKQLTEILQAKTYSAVLEPATASQVYMLQNAAESYKTERSKVSAAESERFLSQLKGYQASPDLFILSSYLDVMVNQTRNTRKFVLASNLNNEVIILNLEKKLKSSLLDLNLGNFDNPQN